MTPMEERARRLHSFLHAGPFLDIEPFTAFVTEQFEQVQKETLDKVHQKAVELFQRGGDAQSIVNMLFEMKAGESKGDS